jgi:hypothetical protein
MARVDLGRLRFFYQGAYSGATEYELNDVVKYGGNVYVYKYATPATAQVPTNTTYWDLMVPGFNFEGVYGSGTAYQPGDVVTYGGVAFICILTSTGNAPTNATYWSTISDGIQFEGAWSSSTNYQENDVVTYGSNIYIALRDTIDDAPDTSASDWAVLAEGLNYRSAWSGSVVYYINDIVNRGGSTYICLLKHTSGTFTTDLAASKWQILTEGFRYRGEWAGNTTYLINDIVYYGVSTYRANAEFTSDATTFEDDEDWELFALGADIPSQASNSGSFLTTDGSSLSWAAVDAFPAQANNAGKLLITDGTNVSWSTTVDSLTANVGDISSTAGNVSAELGLSAANAAFTVDGSTADIITTGELSVDGITYVGVNAAAFETSATLTNPIAVFNIDANDYAQVAIHNSGTNANSSSDLIIYTDDGDDVGGWIDVGITSSNFADAGFTITGAHDGYVFVEAPINAIGQGNLVLATGANGSQNKIIFAAGGLSSDNTQMEITPDVNVHIEIDTPSTSPTTGALTVVGGVGIQGDMNIQGNVDIEGTITFGGGGTTVETANLAVTDPFVFVGSGNQADTVDLAFIGEYATSISTITKIVDNKALTNNLATLTTTVAHTFLVGDVVVVGSVDATFNGTYSITGVTSNTFSYLKTAANVASTAVASGSAAVSARRQFAGVARDAGDGVLKFFKDATTKPTSTVNFSEAGLGFADIRVGGINASGTVALPNTTSIGDVSSTEIGYLDGVTSAIQTQLSNKQDVVANVSDTEIGYLDGVTSLIQTQLDGKINTSLINAAGDLLIGTANDTIARLEIGANGTVLTSNGTTATWAAATGGASLSSIFMLMGA